MVENSNRVQEWNKNCLQGVADNSTTIWPL